MSDLYDADIAAWAEQQANALRRRAANEVDWENVAEEIHTAALLAEAYPSGRGKAEAETGLVGLPESCPWTIDQVLEHAFWPSPNAGQNPEERG